jgi:hypothetical protein
MGAFTSAVESYKKILQYDRERLPLSDPAIARDLNNLGQCYYTAACGTADKKLREQYLLWSKEQLALAQKAAAANDTTNSVRNRVDRSVIQLNQTLVQKDLGSTQATQNMEQSAMMTFADRGR